MYARMRVKLHERGGVFCHFANNDNCSFALLLSELLALSRRLAKSTPVFVPLAISRYSASESSTVTRFKIVETFILKLAFYCRIITI